MDITVIQIFTVSVCHRFVIYNIENHGLVSETMITLLHLNAYFFMAQKLLILHLVTLISLEIIIIIIIIDLFETDVRFG